MAHFAKVEGGVVTDLIVVSNDDCGGLGFPDSEPVGRAFIAELAENDPRLEGEWFQTSFNTFNGLHFPGRDIRMRVDEKTGEVTYLNGSPEGAFRWTFGQVGYRFDPDAGEYGEFRAPEEGV